MPKEWGSEPGFIKTVTSAWSPTISRVMSPRMLVVTTTLGRSPPVVVHAVRPRTTAQVRANAVGSRRTSVRSVIVRSPPCGSG